MPTNKISKIIFVTASTAGHVWPTVYIARKLQKDYPETDFSFYISGSKIEKAILDHEGFKYKKIYGGKWRRYFSFWNFWDIFKTIFGFLQSLFLMTINRPKLIFVKGGFLGVPVAFAAYILGIPIIIHESDAKLGLANRFIARFAKKVLVAFPKDLYQQEKFFSKIESAGIPLSDDFYCKSFSQPKTIKQIMFLGGSLGAKIINDNLKIILTYLLENFEIIHICGKDHYSEFLKIKENLSPNLKSRYRLYDFVASGISQFMQESDLIVSRAGATAIFELSALAKPTIFIPLGMGSSRGDQIDNANFLSQNQAAIIITENQLSAPVLTEKIQDLQKNPQKLLILSKNIHKFSRKDSIPKIISLIKLFL